MDLICGIGEYRMTRAVIGRGTYYGLLLPVMSLQHNSVAGEHLRILGDPPWFKGPGHGNEENLE